MAHKIENQIPISSLERVRDRIGEILAEELAHQATLDPNLDVKKVFVERIIPFNHEEIPCVNVSIARGDAKLLSAFNNQSELSIHIDCYHKAKSNVSSGGDYNSTSNLHRLTTVCNYILSSPFYKTLGFEPGFIGGVHFQQMEFASPKDPHDAKSLTMSRLTINVKVGDCLDGAEPMLLAGHGTKFIIHGADYGYFYDLEIPTT